MANKTYYLPDIVAHFKENGLKVLGQGYHAAVFQSRKTGEVLKVFVNDPCYVMFLSIIADNPSQHFPRVKSYTALKGKYKNYHLVKMEKLESTLHDLGDDYDLLNNIIAVAQCYRQIKERKDIKYNTFRLQNTLKSFIDKNETLCKALNVLADYPKRTICSYDFKAENIMRRNDGTIVIVDPFASF